MGLECAGEQTANTDGRRRPNDDRERFVARIVEQKAMVRARLRDGFRHVDWGQVIVGRTYASFVERGLRSNGLGLSGRLFVRGCRKAKHLRGGNDKAITQPLGPSKILSLDAPYIEGNRVMISLLRIDLDLIFPSRQHAVAAIGDVVNSGYLPCMPHLICGDVGPARITTTDEDGVVHESFHPEALIRPHLWIVLPQGSAVNAGPKGRDRPKRLLAGVARGINAALLHLGADPAASPFLVRGKNPLSPFLWSAALNNETWPTLATWADWVDTRVTTEKLARQAAEIQSGLDKGSSNIAFTAWQKTAYDLLRDLHRSSDAAYLAAVQPSVDPHALADLLRERMPLADLDRDPAWSEVAAERVWERVVTYAAAAWDPARAELVRVARGAMRQETDGMTTRKAQAAAGKRSVAIRADKSLAAMIEAYRAIVEEGDTPTKTAVATRAGVNRRTAIRRWDEVEAGCDFRCIDKKHTPASRAQPEVTMRGQEEADQPQVEPDGSLEDRDGSELVVIGADRVGHFGPAACITYVGRSAASDPAASASG